MLIFKIIVSLFMLKSVYGVQLTNFMRANFVFYLYIL